MPNTVTITGPPTIVGQFNSGGVTYYGWSFPVVVNGEAGVYVDWVDTNDPAAAGAIQQNVIDQLQNNPGALEGISQNDPSQDPSEPGQDDNEEDDDDGGDQALAGNDGGDYGVSV